MAQLQDLLPFTKKLSLLYIDSQDAYRSKMGASLQKIFHMVDESKDGYDALNLYKINRHDIVIVDHSIPSMSATQLVKNIRAIRAGQPILYTHPEAPSVDQLMMLFNYGLQGVIFKPFSLEQLLESLQESVRVAYQYRQDREQVRNMETVHKQQAARLEDAKKHEEKLREDLLYERKRLGRAMQLQKELEKRIEEAESKAGNLRKVHELTGAASKHALQDALKEEGPKALLYLNIDNFDMINSIFGMGQGNKVLVETTKRLERFLPTNASLYHITADEFVILVKKPVASQEVLLAEQVLSMFKEAPIEVGENRHNIQFSIGTDRGEGMQLFAHAIDASKEAKAHGGGCIRHYRSDSGYIVSQRHMLFWINTVRKAIEENRLVAYFQPIISNTDQSIQHYEVLCRIIDEKNQPIKAEKFIDAAVVAGLSTQISRIVIDKAFKHFSTNMFRFSININRNDLEENYLESFLDYKCKRYNIDPDRVYLELVEESSMESSKQMMQQIQRLREAGFHIAVDDFGIEHSMLSRMLQFRADFIKIDSTFIQDLPQNAFHRLVVENIVQFAQKANMKTVAEHVDSEEVHRIVHDLGVDYSQGFFVGRPANSSRVSH
jgi:diguanylate cyclase (GGDEF)-like protein